MKGVDREILLMKLVRGGALSAQERRLLGPSVTRAEVGHAITVLLHRHGRFPLDAEALGGLQLTVTEDGVQVTNRRLSSSKGISVMTEEQAVARYIDQEFGPSCHGLRIR